MKSIVIIGASGHGKVVADVARKNGYQQISFLDDDSELKKCGDYPVLGPSSLAEEMDDRDFFIAIGNAAIRRKLQKKLSQEGKHFPILIHPNAVVAENCILGCGTVVMAGAIVNPGAVIGEGCIVNTSSSVDHDCRLGDYVHVSVGSHIAGEVAIGDNCWIGAGATVINTLRICADCMVAAGAVVVKDIDVPGTYMGVPAKKK